MCSPRLSRKMSSALHARPLRPCVNFYKIEFVKTRENKRIYEN